ncbi:hypothetical protein [Brevibacillus porteri]|uniref:hypothetical protein n=1 Tax=Brevibacillus porteri TaxID=2126350 RepID=UPI003D1A5BAF
MQLATIASSAALKPFAGARVNEHSALEEFKIMKPPQISIEEVGLILERGGILPLG